MKNTLQIFIRTYAKILEGKLTLLCTNNITDTLFVKHFSYYSHNTETCFDLAVLMLSLRVTGIFNLQILIVCQRLLKFKVLALSRFNKQTKDTSNLKKSMKLWKGSGVELKIRIPKPGFGLMDDLGHYFTTQKLFYYMYN